MGGSHHKYQSQSGNKGWKDQDQDKEWRDRDTYKDREWRDKKRDYDRYILPHNRPKEMDLNSIDPLKFKTKDVLAWILMCIEGTNEIVRGMKSDFS